MSSTIYIPIKDHSQRVEGKNFRDFGGIPLWRHAVNKLEGKSVFIDTDSPSLIEEANEIPWVHAFERDSDLCGDKVSVCGLMASFVERFGIRGIVSQIHVTTPFLKRETLDDAIQKTELECKYNLRSSMASCTKLNARLWRDESYGYCPVNHNPLKLEQTQDLPTYYLENSCFYICNAALLMTTKNRVGENLILYPVEFPESLDIDTEEDWALANKVMETM